MDRMCALFLALLGGCALGDRRAFLTYTPPTGEAHASRGISVHVERPRDFRTSPDSVLGEVRSAWGTKTAEVVAAREPAEWIQDAMTEELRHAGFTVVVAPGGSPLRVGTGIRELSCEMGVGYRARLALSFRVERGGHVLLEKTYVAEEHHLLRDKSTGLGVEDALRTSLRRVLALFVEDFVRESETAAAKGCNPSTPLRVARDKQRVRFGDY